MNTLRVLIVDDEPLVRESVRNALAGIRDIQIIGECESVSEAIETIQAQPPDLVLLDVRMQDGSGLDIVRRIGPQRMPPVIFVTAYEEHAVKAFELNAVDYLLKPFDEERLHGSIERARERMAGRQAHSLALRLESLLQNGLHKWSERLTARNGDRIDVIPIDTIDWIESAGNLAEVHCGPKTYLVRDTLNHLTDRLDPDRFRRVHRCYIVNLSRIVAIHRIFGGTYELELRNRTRLTTGRQYTETIQFLIRNSP